MALPHISVYLVPRSVHDGFPLDHRYVVDFYTPVLGPTSVALLGWLARTVPAGQEHTVDLSELAARLGVQRGLARNSPLMRTINRLGLYHLAAWNPEPDDNTDGRLLVLSHLPPVTARQINRWPAGLAAEHARALDFYNAQTDQRPA